MKKQSILLISAISLFTLVSCSNENTSSSSVPSSQTSLTTTTTTTTSSSDTSTSHPSELTVNVNNLSSDDFDVYADKEVASYNETITLTITSKNAGFEIKDVSATLSDNLTPIDLTENEGKYTYLLPEDGTIYLTINKIGKDIKGYIYDEFGLINGNPEMSLDGGSTYSIVDNKDIEYDTTYYTFKYNAKVRFSLDKVDNHVPTGIKVDDTLFSINKDNKVVVDILLDDFEYFFVNINVLFENEGAPTGPYTLQINNTEHLTASVYWGKDGIYPATTIAKDVEAVIRVESTEQDRFSVRKIEYRYFNTTETTSGVTKEATHINDETGEYWTFKVPSCPAKLIIITIYESDGSLLKDLDLDGTYLTFNTYAGSTLITSFSNDYVTVTNAGDVTLYSSEGSVKNQVVITSYNSTKLSSSSYQDYCYGKDCFIFSTDSGISSSFGSYNTFCIKKEKPSDNVADYFVAAEQFKIDSKIYLAYEIYHENQLYQSSFFEMSDKIPYFNCKFNCIKGSSFVDNEVLYEVVKNENVQKVIGYNSDGGNANRCIMDSYYGNYISDDAILSIVGTNNAIYKNEKMNYSLAEDVISLISSTKEVVLRLDDVNRTFEIISEKEKTITLPIFAGKKFRNNYAFEDDYVYLGFYIEFSSQELKLSCVIASDNNLDMEHCSTQLKLKNVDVDYTYDESTGIISSFMTTMDNSTKLVTMEYKNGAIKISSKVIGAGKLYNTTATINEIM